MTFVPERVRWPIASLRWRARGHYRPLPPSFTATLRDAQILEIGGPSALFASGGVLPVYPIARSVDNSQFSAATRWHSLDPETAVFSPDGVATGRQLYIDDLDLPSIPDHTYDAVISSHVIEHFANPLRALDAWARITRPGGHLLIVAPHHQGTFDRRRAITPLSHIVADYEQGTSESDLTHIQETIDLHDFQRDGDTLTASWLAERHSNATTRVVHHHVFSTASLLELIDYAGLKILEHTTRFPHDIYVLARFPSDGSRPDNAAAKHHVDTGPFDQ